MAPLPPRWAAEALPPLLLLLLACRCGGLYDPIHHVESARIYGNIDGYAYYFVDLIIGTPPQRVSVIVDTGSGVTAFPCKSCRHCGQHIDPNFDFDGSSSAEWVACGSSCRTSCRGGHCGYHQGYTEGSSITGWYFQDLVRLGDSVQRNPPVRSTMGCHQDENKLFYTQKANGIMGIRPPGQGAPTILDELFADKAHIDSKVFSLCLAEWGGRIVVGGFNASYHTGSIQYVPLATSSGYYHVPLSKMVLDGRALSTQYGTAMIDSGTTYTYMATEPYRSLRAGIEGYCRGHGGCGAEPHGTCWEAPRGLGGFPAVDVWFREVRTAWLPKAYLYRKGASSRWCYSFEDDGPRANTVLGASWMIHQEIIFDLRTNKVGIVPADCPEFTARPAHDPRQGLAVPTREEVLAAAAAAAKAASQAPPAAASAAAAPEAAAAAQEPTMAGAESKGAGDAAAAAAAPTEHGSVRGTSHLPTDGPSVLPPLVAAGGQGRTPRPSSAAAAGGVAAVALAGFGLCALLVVGGRKGNEGGIAHETDNAEEGQPSADVPGTAVHAEVVGNRDPSEGRQHHEDKESGEEDPLVAVAAAKA